MDLRGNVSEVIEAMAKNEEAVSRLYQAYADKFPAQKAFWSGLAADEISHAAWLRGLLAKMREGSLSINRDRFKIQPVRGFTAYLDGVRIGNTFTLTERFEYDDGEKDHKTWVLTLGGDGPQGLLDIGGSLSQIAVVRGGITRFVRILPTGGAQFTEALMAGASLSREDAEERKRAVGVVPSGLPEGDDEAAALRRLLTRTADGLIEEIRGSVNYYLTQAGEHSLERLLVSGNAARLPHLANRVARALGTRVEPVRVLDHVTVGRVRMTESQLLDLQPVLPAAVGLALWGSFVVPPGSRFSHISREE